MTSLTNLAFELAVATALLTSASGCVSTSLDVPRDHPANPAASTAPLVVSQALAAPPVEPQQATQTAAAAGPQHDHEHAEHHHPPPSSEGTSPQAAQPTSSATPPSAASSKAPAADIWTCPMHPQVVKSGPGQCPICGMNLVKRMKAPPPPEKK